MKTRAALFLAAGEPQEVRELDLEEPRAGEVLVRMEAVGICGTDLHVVKGEWQRPVPMVLGHEGAGVVEAVGAGVEGLGEGDHVVEKMRMNGFYETRLDILLRGLGAETIVITGAWTNMSIEHTARHGADAGYQVVVASDGTSTVDDEWQNAALSYAMQNVAAVATCAEIADALRN